MSAPQGRPRPGSQCLIIHAVGGGGTEILFGAYLDIYFSNKCSITRQKQDLKRSKPTIFSASFHFTSSQPQERSIRLIKCIIKHLNVPNWVFNRIREGKRRCSGDLQVIRGSLQLSDMWLKIPLPPPTEGVRPLSTGITTHWSRGGPRSQWPKPPQEEEREKKLNEKGFKEISKMVF